LKKKHVNLLKIRKILISKFECIGDLKNKILEGLQFSITDKASNNEKSQKISVDISKFKLFQAYYNPDLKRSLIRLIYCFYKNGKKFRIPGKLLENNGLKIQVTINNLLNIFKGI